MIEVLFYFGADVVLVRIRGNHITFVNSQYGAQEASIDGLKLNQVGVIKEFPDLKDNPEWKEKAIIRFKNHVAKLSTEGDIADYIIDDLKKYGYKPVSKQQAGFRPIKL